MAVVNMAQLLTDQLGGITNIHSGNVTTVAKAQDYQYLNSLNSAAHALAWREVQTEPNSSAIGTLLATLAAMNKTT